MYKTKYIKYKNKYLNLKSQFGGAERIRFGSEPAFNALSYFLNNNNKNRDTFKTIRDHDQLKGLIIPANLTDDDLRMILTEWFLKIKYRIQISPERRQQDINSESEKKARKIIDDELIRKALEDCKPVLNEHKTEVTINLGIQFGSQKPAYNPDNFACHYNHTTLEYVSDYIDLIGIMNAHPDIYADTINKIIIIYPGGKIHFYTIFMLLLNFNILKELHVKGNATIKTNNYKFDGENYSENNIVTIAKDKKFKIKVSLTGNLSCEYTQKNNNLELIDLSECIIDNVLLKFIIKFIKECVTDGKTPVKIKLSNTVFDTMKENAGRFFDYKNVIIENKKGEQHPPKKI